MINTKDSLKLAATKLKTRKIRLSVTVIISGLLFSILATASFIANGAMHSLDSFGKEGLGSRYIVSANQIVDDRTVSKSVLNRAIALHKQAIAKKKAEAKKLDLIYDPSAEPQPYTEVEGPNGKEKQLDVFNYYAQQALKEDYRLKPPMGSKEFKEQASAYDAIGFYTSKGNSQSSGSNSGSSLAVLKNDKEDYKASSNQSDGSQQFGPENGTNSFSYSWQLTDSKLLQPFILPATNLDTGSDASIPIVAPYTAVEQLLSIKPLASNATLEQKLDRLKELRDKAPQIQFSVCYRNSTSATQLNDAIASEQDYNQNKSKKDYQKPSLLNGLPKKPCGPMSVLSDTRTVAEKQQAQNQLKFDQMFGQEPAKSQVLKFRVVGISPDMPTGFSFSAADLLSGMVNSSLGNGWFSPIQARDTNKTLDDIFPEQDPLQPPTFYAEFADAAHEKSFIDEKGCRPDYSSAFDPNSDPNTECKKSGKFFELNPYGSQSLALDSFKKTFGKIFKIAGVVMVIVSSIIMLGTVGRVIADGRRETAVFRAIGANRADILRTYLTYTLLLSCLVAAFALIVGLIFSLMADSRWSPSLTNQAIVTYNSSDLTKQFHLFGVSISNILAIIILTISAGILSSILPLLTNLRRNPIKDMRDDN